MTVGTPAICNFGRRRWYRGTIVAPRVFYSEEADRDNVGHDGDGERGSYGHWYLHEGSGEWRTDLENGVPSQNGGTNLVRED